VSTIVLVKSDDEIWKRSIINQIRQIDIHMRMKLSINVEGNSGGKKPKWAIDEQH
jgi:hypothetical protein